MTSSYIDGLPEHTQTMMVWQQEIIITIRRVYRWIPFVIRKGSAEFMLPVTRVTHLDLIPTLLFLLVGLWNFVYLVCLKVRVYNFNTPVQIVVSFAQSPPINWVLFFVIFAAWVFCCYEVMFQKICRCFIVLLVVAGLLWMIKVRIEAYRRNQRRIDEIEHVGQNQKSNHDCDFQMASRPFASTKMELSILSQFSSAGGPTPLSIEPCSNYRAGVFTLAVRLPTGGRAVTPSGTSGLAVASSLCLLTPQQVGVLQAQENGENISGRKRNFRSLLSNFPIRQRPAGDNQWSVTIQLKTFNYLNSCLLWTLRVIFAFECFICHEDENITYTLQFEQKCCENVSSWNFSYWNFNI